jgi:transcriptional regulator with XRE-family HTH domain
VYISRKLNLSDSVCSQWEGGKTNPSTAHLVKLAKILGVSFEWLALGEVDLLAQSSEDLDIIINNLNPHQKMRLTQFMQSMI